MWFTKPLNIQISAPTNGYIQRALQGLHTDGLDLAAYGRLFQHFTDRRLPRQAKQLHSRLVLFSVKPGNFLASKLINFYSRANQLKQAHKVFDEIPQKNTFAWNALLIGYSIRNMHTDTLRVFSAMVESGSPEVKPDNFTITCVMKALGGLFSGSDLAKEVHCFVLRYGFDSDVFVANCLMTFYSRCDEVGMARSLFDRMPGKDIVSWNSMIAGYSQAGYYGECKELYREMVESVELRPDDVTAVSVLQACVQSSDLKFGMEVHQFLNESHIEMNVMLYNALIGLYARCGKLDCAQELFDGMSEKDDVTYGSLVSGYMFHGFVDKAMDIFRECTNRSLSTWNAMISGLVQNNRHEAAIELVREMQACGFKPNTVTLSSVLPAISYFSNLKVGKEIHAHSVRNNFDWNIYVATAIIDTYAKSGFLPGAQQVFDQSKYKSLVIWTAIISAYAAHGDAYVSIGLFYKMLSTGIQPDEVTFTAVLTACSHSGVVDEAWKIFKAMFPVYGIHPSVEHYACMVGVLSRAGRLTEAAELIQNMSIEPSAKVWGALLNGASVACNVELGKFVCDRLFQMEPENTGNYIIMANLYSQAGRWEEADKVRERMKEVGLQKIPGISWIETIDGLHSFIARDASNVRTEAIYEILEGLLGLMKEKGYVLQDELDEESVNG
ncbi:putative tetratricopeptide-like helical domain-containing protein [Rosa chinensis]|uniref:Putative tetratricopeptide-like helical domain-containing protein n=1 Tax=Rosa chinensis TaxID=74649 RepID=A0A2P6RAF6_ROSCH|nr:pentatricopeptide repeat-containing protein At2g37310 [Rosa chinensis]PRQ43401.1 putative tetratricopeptide-like helical domain-containing protein [Rosa chinensis]